MSAVSFRVVSPVAGWILFASLAASSATAHGARLLVSNDDAAATIDESFVCDRVAPVSIESSSFELFEADSLRMQSLVDSVQAVLRYECGDLEELDVTGYLKGLPQPVFEARARAVDGWHVDAERTLKPGAATAPSPAADAVRVREIAVAGNRLDMTVDEVGDNIREIFGAEPRYDDLSGVMTLELGGCPPDYFEAGRRHGNPESGWTCVEALFSDRRVPTLYRFAYTQVVEGSLGESVDVLVDHFGEPDSDRETAGNGARELVWLVESADAGVTEVLRANVDSAGDNVIVNIVLEDPAVTGEVPAGSDDGDAGEMKLRL